MVIDVAIFIVVLMLLVLMILLPSSDDSVKPPDDCLTISRLSAAQVFTIPLIWFSIPLRFVRLIRFLSLASLRLPFLCHSAPP